MNDSSCQECLDAMFQRTTFGIRPGLDIIRHLASCLAFPHKQYRIIHVAGTNGKGSVCAYLSAILSQAGFCVGTYTSPHLVRFNERICVNGNMISDQEVLDLYSRVSLADTGYRPATFFEITTAMAFVYFAWKKVDWAVVETGMGGRFDATNIVEPDICVITNISVDHGQYLGRCIQDIAREKAGIIKSCVPVITGVSQKSAMEEVRRAAQNSISQVYVYGKDFSARKFPHARHGKNRMKYRGIFQSFDSLTIPLEGDHQKQNLCLALACWEMLCHCKLAADKGCSDKRYDLSQTALDQGLSRTQWPGRLEILQKNPLVILDGAHNSDAAAKLAQYLKRHLAGMPLTLVLGILDDKPYEDMIAHLLPLAGELILTRPKTPRSLDTRILKQAARKYISGPILEIQDVAQAASFAISQAKKNEAVCLAGSLYLAGEVKAEYRKITD